MHVSKVHARARRRGADGAAGAACASIRRHHSAAGLAPAQNGRARSHQAAAPHRSRRPAGGRAGGRALSHCTARRPGTSGRRLARSCWCTAPAATAAPASRAHARTHARTQRRAGGASERRTATLATTCRHAQPTPTPTRVAPSTASCAAAARAARGRSAAQRSAAQRSAAQRRAAPGPPARRPPRPGACEPFNAHRPPHTQRASAVAGASAAQNECARARAQSRATADQQPAACVQLRSLHLSCLCMCSKTYRQMDGQADARRALRLAHRPTGSGVECCPLERTSREPTSPRRGGSAPPPAPARSRQPARATRPPPLGEALHAAHEGSASEAWHAPGGRDLSHRAGGGGGRERAGGRGAQTGARSCAHLGAPAAMEVRTRRPGLLGGRRRRHAAAAREWRSTRRMHTHAPHAHARARTRWLSPSCVLTTSLLAFSAPLCTCVGLVRSASARDERRLCRGVRGSPRPLG